MCSSWRESSIGSGDWRCYTRWNVSIDRQVGVVVLAACFDQCSRADREAVQVADVEAYLVVGAKAMDRHAGHGDSQDDVTTRQDALGRVLELVGRQVERNDPARAQKGAR